LASPTATELYNRLTLTGPRPPALSMCKATLRRPSSSHIALTVHQRCGTVTSARRSEAVTPAIRFVLALTGGAPWLLSLLHPLANHEDSAMMRTRHIRDPLEKAVFMGTLTFGMARAWALGVSPGRHQPRPAAADTQAAAVPMLPSLPEAPGYSAGPSYLSPPYAQCTSPRTRLLLGHVQATPIITPKLAPGEGSNAQSWAAVPLDVLRPVFLGSNRRWTESRAPSGAAARRTRSPGRSSGVPIGTALPLGMVR
jgi:hypothetical protein